MNDELAMIKLDLETDRDITNKQHWWMVDEIERLRFLHKQDHTLADRWLAEKGKLKAGIHDALGRHQVTHCHAALRAVLPFDEQDEDKP